MKLLGAASAVLLGSALVATAESLPEDASDLLTALEACALRGPSNSGECFYNNWLAHRTTIEKYGFSTPSINDDPAEAAGPGNWAIERETSAIDDSEVVYATLESKPYVGDYSSDEVAALVVRCREKEVVLIVGYQSAFFGISRKPDVVVRFDSEKAEEETWSTSTTGGVVGIWETRKAVEFSKRLTRHRNLTIRAFQFSGRPLEATFDLTGAERAIDAVAKACPSAF
jgi:hypothetical protein